MLGTPTTRYLAASTQRALCWPRLGTTGQRGSGTFELCGEAECALSCVQGDCLAVLKGHSDSVNITGYVPCYFPCYFLIRHCDALTHS